MSDQDYYIDENINVGSAETTSPVTPENEESDEMILAKLTQQKKLLEEEQAVELKAQQEMELAIQQHIEDVQNNIGIFVTWMQTSYKDKNLPESFQNSFDDDYRSKLFENICEFFKHEEYITDEVLFYLKCIIVCLLKASRKYRTCLDKLEFDIETQETNLRLVRDKYNIRCFIADEHICYFKDNGNLYYVS